MSAEHISAPLARVLANIKREIEMRQDRADMRADSALDEAREHRERQRDYHRYEAEAERAQMAAHRQAAYEKLIRMGILK